MMDESRIIITAADLDNAPPDQVVTRAEGSSILVISHADLQPELRLDARDLLLPLVVSDPSDGLQSHASQIDVVGRTSPNVRLKLTINGIARPIVIADHTGTFRFENVQLVNGNNRLTIEHTDEPQQSINRVTIFVHLRSPYSGQKDWYTREELTMGKEIVRCRNPRCNLYVLKATWDLEGCYCNARGNQYFTSVQPEFYTLKDEVIQIR